MEFTPEMDARIVELYTEPLIRGSIAAQARVWKCKGNQINYRANQLQLIPTSRKKNSQRWTTKEIELLRSMAHLTHKKISSLFSDMGYQRTPDAIETFRIRDGWRARIEHNEIAVGYTAKGLAEIMGVDPKTIQRWIRLKYLKAQSEGGDIRIGFYRIKPKAIQRFLTNYIHYVDLTKIDKYWLIDILTSRY